MRQGRSHSTEDVGKRRTFGCQSSCQRFRSSCRASAATTSMRICRCGRSVAIAFSTLILSGLVFCLKTNECLFRAAYAQPIEVWVSRYDRIVPTLCGKDDFIDVRSYFYFTVEQFFYVATILRPGVHDPDVHGFKIAIGHFSTDADQCGHPEFNLVRVRMSRHA